MTVHQHFEQFCLRGEGTVYSSQLAELRNLILRIRDLSVRVSSPAHPSDIQNEDLLEAIFTSIVVLQNDTMFQNQKRDLTKIIEGLENLGKK